ncbi:SgcJ/EcaC family oxidoreductase [Gulosibacter sp. 10]|uniref:YybH family protein n=1 Tax=Gulosibacter sp. 10 TaxID=1255570 RepID=UPI00097E9A3E|nr:SgcJ/EcaC family oxidoreductase [Gulosibacter sp. 10]SJM51465.1 hypothetical protein FM112_01985 [Gulosibacter sp. 10]
MQKPEDVLDGFAAAWNDRDAPALAGLFVEEPEFVNVVGKWWHTRERIREAHQYGFDVIFPESTITFTERRVRSLGAEAALVHGQWRMVGQSALGTGEQHAEERHGIFSFAMQRFEDGWRAVAAQNTDIIEGATSIQVVDGRSRPANYRGED